MTPTTAPPAAPHLAILVHSYHPQLGGVERQTASVSAWLHESGMQVDVLARRAPGLRRSDRVDGVPVHRLPAPGPAPLDGLGYTLTALGRIGRLQPDVLHAQDLFAAGLAGALAKRCWRLPLVVTIHRSGPIGDLRALAQLPLGRHRWATIAAAADVFVVISREIALELEAAGVPPERQVAIPNGVDESHYQPATTGRRHALRRQLGLAADAPIAVFAGRLVALKRVAHLVEIWPAVRQAVPDAGLLILGDGPEAARLGRSPPPGVRLEGRRDDVLPYLQAADLFVLPSIAEGLSMAVLEAQASGLPVLTTRVGGAGELVEPGANGWLVPPDDRVALQAALVGLLSDAGLRARMGAAGRARVLERFTLSRTVDRLRALYVALAARRGGAHARPEPAISGGELP